MASSAGGNQPGSRAETPAAAALSTSQLTARIAHDVNNILGGVLAQVDLARAALARGEDPRAHLDEVVAIARRGSRIVDALLDRSARPPAGATGRPDNAAASQDDVSTTALVVDDEATILAAMTAALERSGHEVVVAGDGDAAWRCFEESVDRIGVLITDLMLPGCSGAELVRRVRVLRPDLPVLIISGYAGDHLDQLDLDAPRTEFLAKPFRLQEFLDALQRLRSLA